MAGFTNYLEGKVLDLIFGATAYSVPGTIYAALFTTCPIDDGTGGTEVSGGSYARVAITNNTTNFPNATLGNPSTKKNGTVITFPTATANWGTVIGMGFYDASSAGNLLAWSPLTGTSYAYTAATSDTFTAPGSAFSNTDTVRLLFDLGGTTPTGVNTTTTYYIISASGATFQLSLTSGGAAVDITAAGSGRIALLTSKTIQNGDTASFAVDAVTIALD